MNALELLEAIGDVDGKHIWEAQAARVAAPRHRASKFKVLILAAAMILLLTGCTYAVVMRLQNMKIGQWVPNPADMTAEEQAKPHSPRDMISLKGCAGSPNFLAAQEWLEFENSYDPDRALLHEADRSRYIAPEAYDAVLVYTQEMQDKVDEICEKYGLKLPGCHIIVRDAEENLFPILGIQGIHRAEADITTSFDGGGYFYQNGSFSTTGSLFLNDPNWPNQFFYGYGYSNKAYFGFGDSKAVTDVEDFDEWAYTAADGTELLLAIGPEECLVMADRGDVFITIQVHYPSIGEIVFGVEPMTHEVLEAFADCFDYNIKPLGIGQTFPSYADFLTKLCPTPTENDWYLLRDLDGDGSEELLVTYAGSFNLVLTMDGEQAKIVYFAPDLWLSGPENVILDNTYQDGAEIYRMLKFREGRFEYVNYIENSVLKDGWGKSVSLGDAPCWEVPITSDEAWDIINSYDIRQPRWSPVADFPGLGGAPIEVTEAPATPGIPTPDQLGREAETDLEFYLDGQPTATSAQLFIGRGYSMYVNETDWYLERSENTDRWTSEYNPDVELTVTFYPGMEAEAVRRKIKAREPDYDLGEDKRGGLNGLSQDWVMNLNISIFETDSGTFAVACRHPMVGAEGFATRLSVMADTFEPWN